MFRVKQILAAVSLCLLMGISYPATVYTAESSSTNYSVDEVNFGSGGSLNSCSGSYCAKQSAGELVVGETNSTNYSARGGFNTDREAVLEMSVASGVVDLGVLDATTTKTGTKTFSVRTFPAYGYSVIIDGTSPTNKTNGHVLAPMGSAAASTPGIEQFGLNLRANTSPVIGADPEHVPSNIFAYGAAATGYASQNNFKYTGGDTIAESPKGTGQTNYTISIIANVSTNTPSGSYGGKLVLIAVPTF